MTVIRFLVGIVMCVAGSVSALASDESELFDQLLALAKAEDAEAQYFVGMMFNNGIGVDHDPEEAFDWFVKSSAGGDALGAYKVGCYYAGQFGAVQVDLDKAHEYKLVAAEAGYSLAQADVAVKYALQDNWEDALKWWVKSARQGYPTAMHNLSVLYLEGEHVSQNTVLAYAYRALIYRAERFADNKEANADLEKFSAGLSAAELGQARAFISDWKELPTPLTIRADEGIQAALKHSEGAD